MAQPPPRQSGRFQHPAPTTRLYGYKGLQKDTGIEFQTSGALTRDISILGGVTSLHPFIEHAAASSGINHKQAAGILSRNANFLLDYHPKILHSIAFNANTHYTSPRPANIYNTTMQINMSHWI